MNKSFSQSLAFLDLITCGLGAVLLMLLVLLVIVRDFSLRQDPHPQPSPNDDAIPYVAVITFSPLTQEQSAELPRQPLFSIAENLQLDAAIQIIPGPDYVLVYAMTNKKGSNDRTIHLRVFENLRAEIMILQNGRQSEHEVFLSKGEAPREIGLNRLAHEKELR